MKKTIKCSVLIISIVFISNCGVKGKPQSPLIPPYIGNGIKEVNDGK